MFAQHVTLANSLEIFGAEVPGEILADLLDFNKSGKSTLRKDLAVSIVNNAQWERKRHRMNASQMISVAKLLARLKTSRRESTLEQLATFAREASQLGYKYMTLVC